jgi:hypothetical protein
MPVFRCLLLSVALSAIPACGPGLDEGEGGLPTLSLVETRPAQDDTKAEITTDVQMVFNETINPSSVTDETVLLHDDQNERIAGQLQVTDRTVRFRPAKLLRLSTQHQVHLEDNVRSIRNNYLAMPEEWSFSTRRGAFAPSRLMGGMDRYNSRFQTEVASDNRGKAWAPQKIAEPRVATDSAGNALVSWITQEEGTDDIYFSVFDSAASQWAPPALFKSLAPKASHTSHASAMISDERPVVFWSLEERDAGSVWYSELDAPTALWTPPQRLSQHPTGAIGFPPGSPAVAGTGQMVPFWLVETRVVWEVDGVQLFYTHQDMWGAVFQ